MKEYVLDASVTLSWFFDEAESKLSRALLEKIHESKIWVPSCWPLEVANGLLSAERRSFLTVDQSNDCMNKLFAFEIIVDDGTSEQAFSSIPALARQHQLTSYDAAYLELAIRGRLPLATFDKALRKSAEKEGILDAI